MLLIFLPQNQGVIFLNLQAYYTMKLYIFQDNLAFYYFLQNSHLYAYFIQAIEHLPALWYNKVKKSKRSFYGREAKCFPEVEGL